MSNDDIRLKLTDDICDLIFDILVDLQLRILVIKETNISPKNFSRFISLLHLLHLIFVRRKPRMPLLSRG
ncbi:hypothetical protein D3C73_1228460 [compost metagenome]